MRKTFLLLILCALPSMAKATGGACPTEANYLNASGSLVTLASLGVTNCYYFSKSSGSDSNSGTTEGSPQQHLPGMASYTGSLSTTLVAGTGYILKGGDSWTHAANEIPLVPFGNGTSSNPIYIGIDLGWYSGSAWTRPIFDASASGSFYAMAYLISKYLILDNIEFTNLKTSGGVTTRMVAIGQNGGQATVERCYFHGWNHSVTGDADNSNIIASQGGPGNSVHDNVIDGADTLAATGVSGNPCGYHESDATVCQGMMIAISGTIDQIYNNYIANVTTGINSGFDIAHDNWIGPVWLGFTGGHRNGIFNAGAASASTILLYNNVITQVQNGGMGQLWIEQGSGNSGKTAYIFGNIEFNTASGNNVNLCQLGPACGPLNFFNNTFECGKSGSLNVVCAGVGTGPPFYTANFINNHCIITGSTCALTSRGGETINESSSLVQTTAQANANSSPHFDQYTESQTYPFSPVASTNSTVGTGTNESSLCTTISGINAAAGTACTYSTSYAGVYNTSNHTVGFPAFPLVSRGTWDKGSYQYSGTPSVPNPSFSPGAGNYTSAQIVTISDSLGGSSITYCQDTSNTCTPGTSYSSPVSITGTGYLRAQATHGGYTASGIASAFYQISQLIQSAKSTSCSNSATCTITISSTGTGNLLLFPVTWYVARGGLPSVSSVTCTSTCGTWVQSTNSYNTSTSGTISAAQAIYYVLSSTAGATSVTLNLSADSSATDAFFYEVAPLTGLTASLDTSGTIIDASNCTSCVGVALTLARTNDVVVQNGNPANSITGISGGTYGNLLIGPIMQTGTAIQLGSNNGAAPTFVQAPAGPMMGSAAAFTYSGGGGSPVGSLSPTSASFSTNKTLPVQAKLPR